MLTSEFAIRFMLSAVSAKALLKFWIAVSVSAFMCSPPSRSWPHVFLGRQRDVNVSGSRHPSEVRGVGTMARALVMAGQSLHPAEREVVSRGSAEERRQRDADQKAEPGGPPG
jgi:hypothetical protein